MSKKVVVVAVMMRNEDDADGYEGCEFVEGGWKVMKKFVDGG